MPWAAALAQDGNALPVTQASPAAAVASPSPEATASPAASPAAAEPSPTATPTPAMSGTAPALSGTTPASSETGGTAAGATAVATPTPVPPYSIDINLAKQRAYLYKDGKEIAEAPISSGRAGHLTPTGNFSVVEKDLNHFSSLYGKFVDRGSGRVVKSGADVAMGVPKGCKFVPAPMKWFMRFEGAAGMHAGILPGYPASHGCVRMPASKAQLFYQTVTTGTPVHVFGTTPTWSGREAATPRRRVVAATPRATPTPKPTPKRGWWPF